MMTGGHLKRARARLGGGARAHLLHVALRMQRELLERARQRAASLHRVRRARARGVRRRHVARARRDFLSPREKRERRVSGFTRRDRKRDRRRARDPRVGPRPTENERERARELCDRARVDGLVVARPRMRRSASTERLATSTRSPAKSARSKQNAAVISFRECSVHQIRAICVVSSYKL